VTFRIFAQVFKKYLFVLILNFTHVWESSMSAEIRNGDRAMSRGSDVKIATLEIKALIEMQ
jgi:hypothetical protein